jgi:hypothetical protein
MNSGNFKNYFLSLILVFAFHVTFGQGNVPMGVHYQAVARDNYGKELVNKKIDVRFSIISGNPLGTMVYQELQSNVITSKYGVFSLIIGRGIPTGGTFGELSQVQWSSAYHFLKVEVKFDNDYIDMGTMQFLAVPYALYAQKSLEPGPQGPQGVQGQKGDPGDPASDNQTLSFDGSNLSLTVGNGNQPSVVNLSVLSKPHSLELLGDTLSILGGNSVGLPNQIQDLQLDINNKLKITKNDSATEIDLTRFLDNKNQTLTFNPVTQDLSISDGNTQNLSPLLQDLRLTNDKLKITGLTAPTEIDLGQYRQNLSFNNNTGLLSITNGSGADLSALKNDEIQDIHLSGNQLTIDRNPASAGVDLSKYMDNTDNQTLTYNGTNNTLTILNGNTVSLGSIVAFRAKKLISTTATSMTEITFIPESIPGTDEYNDGNAFNRGTGEFIAPNAGIYTFSINYFADGLGSARKLIIYYNLGVYEEVAVEIGTNTLTTKSITMKLNATDIVRLRINTGTSTQSGTGSFSGYKVY